MERKYYLRGLGVGIVVTAVIMGMALSGSHKMTDEEIMKRARELGMVEDTYLSDTSADEEQQAEQNQEDSPEGQAALPVAEPEPESSQAAKEDIPETAEPAEPEEGTFPVAQPVEPEAVPEEIESPKTEIEKDTNEMTRQEDTASLPAKRKRVTIVSGDGSYTVALKLKEAGAVMSAESFDDFLCERGYDKKLRTGTFQIPADASEEQIARIVTGQE